MDERRREGPQDVAIGYGSDARLKRVALIFLCGDLPRGEEK